MTDKILEWASKTGYPLELYGESVLSEMGFAIFSSHLYKDPENQVHRELDLYATYLWNNSETSLVLLFDLLIECKKSEKPFILLANQNNEERDYILGGALSVVHPMLRPLAYFSKLRVPLPSKTSSGFKLIQAFSTSDEVIHKAVNTLVKSFLDWIKVEDELADMHIKKDSHHLPLPFLLLDAPLFEMRLSDNELQITELESCILMQNIVVENETHSFSIPVITKPKLRAFLQTIIEKGDDFFGFLITNPDSTIKNYYKPFGYKKKKRKK